MSRSNIHRNAKNLTIRLKLENHANGLEKLSFYVSENKVHFQYVGKMLLNLHTIRSLQI